MVETTSLFDLVLTGQLAQGVERASAVAQLALLFKMPTDKIEALFSSAPVVLKRDLAWDLAKRYRVAIKQAGALSDIRPAESIRAEATEPVNASPAPQPVPAAAESAPAPAWSLAAVGADVLTAEERVAPVSRLAEFSDFALRPKDGNLLDAAEMTAVVTAPTDLGTGFNLLPPGTDVLADHERALPVAALVETPDYELAAPGERLSRANTTPVSAPDTAHLSLSKHF